jgi:hypothetical protein
MDRSCLKRLLLSTALVLACAAGVHAADVVGVGGPGGDAYADAETTDPSNTAQATGGAGGYNIGGSGSNSLNGGSGGMATAIATASVSASATATGGAGGFVTSDTPILGDGDFGGLGGAATATAYSSSVASATATGGQGGSDDQQYSFPGPGNPGGGGDATATAVAASSGGPATATASASGGAGGATALSGGPFGCFMPGSFPVCGPQGGANATSSATTTGGRVATAESTAVSPGPSTAQSTAQTSFAFVQVGAYAQQSLGSTFPPGINTAENTIAITQGGGSGQPFLNPGPPTFNSEGVLTITSEAFAIGLPGQAYVASLVGGASNVADALMGPRDVVFGTAILDSNSSGQMSATFDFRYSGDLLLGLIDTIGDVLGEFTVVANGVTILTVMDPDINFFQDNVINLGSFSGSPIDLTISGGGFDFAVGGAIPEPSTCAMMLTGFLGLGLVAFCRGRRGQVPVAA